ncbi:hypothetical protein LV478_13850 [Komagataeibacter oboediens]|uniref:hypothetical protein n=1 Tax=Komagataeibacter oboediens TaxID=65958 RepID=UPI0023D9B5D5|nr:hypothetical protein [Komagataeibacter oboediens]WEQ51592.1 hypothetical protein LV478_13850 [Komagataeibacter oboediens]
MDRQIVYPAQIPLDSDQLNAQRNAYVGLGQLAAMAYGWATVSASGFACMPGSGLAVVVAPGSLLAPGVVDKTAYGTLPAASSALVRQYGSRDPVTLAVPGAGATYSVYVTPATVDADDTVLPFYNAADPSVTYAGADNSGKTAPTVRQDVAQVGIGTSVPAGAYPLWTVTVPAGAAAITAAMITQAGGAPFYDTIPQLQVSVDSRVPTAADDTGAVNGRVSALYYDKVQQQPVVYAPSATSSGLALLVSQTFGATGFSTVSNFVYRASDGALQINVGSISAGVVADFAPVASVQAVQANLSSFQTTQTNTNATLSADISQCVSGVYGVATSAGDRQGKGLYQAGGSGRPTFVYNNGATDVYSALAYYADVTALSATLSTDISNCVSGVAASGDAQGLKLYQSVGSGRPHFFYTGGDEYLATYTDVTTVQANLTSFQTSQANQNSTFAAEIASKVGTNTTNDGVNSPITYLGHNNASGAPFVISSLAGSYRIIPSRPGAGFNSISNMSTDSSGNIILKDSSTADAYVYAPTSTGTIAANGNISGGWWVKTGNILRQCLKITSTTVSGTIEITFPTAYADVPTVSAEWADLDGNSAWANVLTQNGAPVISATGVSLWARALGQGGALADSAGWGWVTVEGPVAD